MIGRLTFIVAIAMPAGVSIGFAGCIWQDECVNGAERVGGRCVRADGGRDAGREDAETDLDAGPPVPSTPGIEVSPSTPTTTDDLLVRVVSESIDPLDEEVTYEFEWTIDGTPMSAGTVLDHSLTSKGETWSVRVLPTAGGRAGEAANESVVIANTPPTVKTAGLSTYHPIARDRVRAFGTPNEDVDGDAVTLRFEWLRNGSPVPDVTVDTIDLASAGFEGGDDLSVRVRPHDGDDLGPAFELGPYTLRPAVTQWRQILPHRTEFLPLLTLDGSAGTGVFVYDTANDRVVMKEERGGLWEKAFGPSSGPWVELPVSGEHPVVQWPTWVYDERDQRVVVFGGYDVDARIPSTEVWSLDLRRGGEQWSEMVVGGDPPPAFVRSSALFDAARDRVVVFGSNGAFTGAPGHRELWELDLGDGGSTWHRIATTDSPSAQSGATWLHARGSGDAYLMGGTLPDSSDATDEIWHLDLETDELTRAESALPRPVNAGAAVTDGSGGALFFGESG